MFEHLSKVRPVELKDVSLHELLYQIIAQKHGPVDAKGECTKFILSMKRLSAGDERIRFLSEVLGVNLGGAIGKKQKRQPNYMAAFYVAIIVATGLHLDEVLSQRTGATIPLSQAYGFLVRFAQLRPITHG